MQIARLAATAVALAALGFSQAQAQESRARTFVDSVSFTSETDALARWEDRICVGAVGLAPGEAQALVDRISARAQQVGLRPGEPGCRANVMVIYAPDSDRLSREIVDQRRDLLGYFEEEGRETAGREAMEAFASEARAIRWWHVSSTGRGSLRPVDGLTYQASGQSAAASAGGDGGAASDVGSSLSDFQGMEAVRVNPSRTRTQVRPNNLTYALVVVDARRVGNVPAGAWMDYVAFVALAQVDARARTEEFPTVLNLFSSPTPASGLTNWDEAYLEGLYAARNETANRQAASISRRMSNVASE